ncbi:hypothetical protein PG985_006929 [Apiospora marii]|uniref:BZIP domain-containing protein n=1 Tax=Apiospora marii TaxID=335849 RepID=A0ABR1SFJ0_9PEZI
MATQPQSDHGDRDDNGGSSRPSFAKFWKRSKAKLEQRRNITFVSANTGIPNGELAGQAPNTLRHDESIGKAEARRAQVRRAQIQHRQRKANYAKELEMDIVRLRGDIERCKADCWTLAGENQGMRQQLAAAAAAAAPVDHRPVMLEMVANPLPLLPPQEYGGETLAAAAAAAATTWVPLPSFDFEPGYIAYLDVDGNLGSPAFQVTRVTTSDQEGSAGLPFGEDGDRGKPVMNSSGEETDKAINFVLALEHICWSHFKAVDFQLHNGNQPSPSPLPASSCTGDVGIDPCHGYALMVSAMALQQAPNPVFQRLESHASTAAPEPPHLREGADGSNSVAWHTTGLTLESLYDLASTLNLPDLELAPVQAWFEIIREYGPGAVLGDGSQVLERLIAELSGLVKCLSFGAVIEREAFDSVLCRVLGDKTISQG